MRTHLLSALLLACCTLAACGKKADGPDEVKVSWPSAPSDGTPLVLEFKAIADHEGDRVAHMELFNFADKAVTDVQLTLHYLDTAGAELKTFPWSQAKRPQLAGAKGTADLPSVGFALPPATTTVKAVVQRVTYADGTTWERPAS